MRVDIIQLSGRIKCDCGAKADLDFPSVYGWMTLEEALALTLQREGWTEDGECPACQGHAAQEVAADNRIREDKLL